MYDNEADEIVDEIDRLIAWHAPAAHLADWVTSADPQMARDDLPAVEVPVRIAAGPTWERRHLASVV